MRKLSKEFTLIAMMRVKNEEEWLEESIIHLLPLADRIIVLDDGSTDGTAAICQRYSEEVEYHYQNEPVTDEARDKNRLLEWTVRHDPDWILALDGDEVLEELAPSTIIREIHLLDPAEPQFTVLLFHFLYFWNDPGTYRAEPGIYSNFWQPRLFTLRGQPKGHLSFTATEHGANLHCGSVPGNLAWRPRKLDVKVKHYGYLWPEQRQRKKAWYAALDPGQAAAGYYDHLTSEEGMILAAWEERKQAASASFVKEITYFQGKRQEIVELIPHHAECVLDIGCGYGFVGREIKRRFPQIKVFGVEVEAAAAQVAKAVLDGVVAVDIEADDPAFPNEHFDCIILADVLEHLRDPWKVLLKVHRLLKKDGVLIISIPNIRNLGIIQSLLAGYWRYVPAGILDNTHLRFFTFREFQRNLYLLGFRPIQVMGLPDLTLDPLVLPEGAQHRILADGFEWGSLDRDTVQQLKTVQFVFLAKKARYAEQAKEQPLTSIIIPVHNHWEVTKLALDHLHAYTPEPFELIVIDNGSDEPTQAYLRNLSDAVVIRNEQNEGFARACNQGLAAARGERIVLLNNDVLVGEHWLGNLIDHLDDEPGVGIVGPCTNYAGTDQKTRGDYAGVEQFQGFVREFYLDHYRSYALTYRLAGFCMLIKREVIDAIGGFDERFGTGNFEDDDFCLRAAIAGYKIVIAQDTYVHHIGSVTFRGHTAAYAQIMEKNWEQFKIKWQIDVRIQDRGQLSLSRIAAGNYPRNRYYLPLDQSEEELQRRRYDRMFREREVINQAACQLDYWENHICTQAALQSGILGEKILDAGCGSGEIDIWLARKGYTVTGVDISPVGIQRAVCYLTGETEEVAKRLSFYQEPLHRLPFTEGAFDTCLLFEVLEHIEDPASILKELGRVLKREGHLLITVPLEDYYKDSTHVHSFTPQSLENLLRQYAENVAVTCSAETHQLIAVVAGIK